MTRDYSEVNYLNLVLVLMHGSDTHSLISNGPLVGRLGKAAKRLAKCCLFRSIMELLFCGDELNIEGVELQTQMTSKQEHPSWRATCQGASAVFMKVAHSFGFQDNQR